MARMSPFSGPITIFSPLSPEFPFAPSFPSSFDSVFSRRRREKKKETRSLCFFNYFKSFCLPQTLGFELIKILEEQLWKLLRGFLHLFLPASSNLRTLPLILPLFFLGLKVDFALNCPAIPF